MQNPNGVVEIIVAKGTPDEKKFQTNYVKTVFETAADIMSWLQDAGKQADLIASLNYGHDLRARAKVRIALETASAGPDKAIDQMLKKLCSARVAMGKSVTPEWQAKKRAEISASLED